MTSRKLFLSTGAAIAAATTAVPAPGVAEAATPGPVVPPYFPLLKRGEYNYSAMMATITLQAKNRQCYLSDATMNGLPGIPNVFEKMTNGWTAYEFAFLPRPARQECSRSAVC